MPRVQIMFVQVMMELDEFVIFRAPTWIKFLALLSYYHVIMI